MPVRARTLARRASWHVCWLLIMVCVNIVSMSKYCITLKWLDVCGYFHKAGMYVWVYVCMYVRMHVGFHRALLARALPVESVRMPARRASSHLLDIARMYFMHVCMLDAMYVCFHRALLGHYFPVARVRMLARRTSSRLLVIAGIYFMHICVVDARYVRCRRVSHARAMSCLLYTSPSPRD